MASLQPEKPFRIFFADLGDDLFVEARLPEMSDRIVIGGRKGIVGAGHHALCSHDIGEETQRLRATHDAVVVEAVEIVRRQMPRDGPGLLRPGPLGIASPSIM
jgi:hypothetical protein